MRFGLSLSQFNELAKRAFVEKAAEQLTDANAKVNVSRISAMTGIYRSEVQRLLESKEPESLSQSLTARVLTLWEQLPEYKDRRQAPRILTYAGPDSEFATLVNRVSSHLNPGTVLFEICRSGSAVKTPQGLRLKKAALETGGNTEQALALLAQEIEALSSTVTENISSNEELKKLHIRTEFDNIPEAFVAEIKQFVLEEGRAFHKRMRERLSGYDADVNPVLPQNKTSSKTRVVVTAFLATLGEKVGRSK
jgi:hypothetical protein